MFRAEGERSWWMTRVLITTVWIKADHAASEMDSFELFQKLGAGAKFDLKRFGQDAARFKVHIENLAGGILDENSD